jgi:hypothetical protein
MATRLYLPASAGTVPFSPTPDAAWENTGSLFRARARTVSSGSAIATVNFTDSNNTDQDCLIAQYVTRPLRPGQTVTGAQSLKAQVRCSEVNAGNNLFLTLGIRIVNMLDGLVKKTILAVTRDAVEINTSLQNRQFTATSAATNYTTVEGDCLVIEIGVGGDPASSNTHSSALSLGDNAAADLAEDDTTTTANNPWVELVTDTLQFSWAISIGSKNYAFTGSAVGLRRGYPMAVGTGSYSLSGSDVGLRRGYPLSVGSGSFALTGSSVTLTYAGAGGTTTYGFQWKRVHKLRYYGMSGRRSRRRVISTIRMVPVATVTVTASNSYSLAIDSANFAYSGNAVGLAHGYKIGVGSENYPFSGNSTGLGHGRKIAISDANYPFTGSAVGLAHGYKVGVGSANYPYSGNTISFPRTYAIAVGSGNYPYSGSAVGLAHGYKVGVTSANYPFAGSSVGLLFGHKIGVGTTNFPFTGSAVTLRRGYPLSVDSGTYGYTGSAVGLIHGWKEPIESANYPFTGASVDLRYSGAQARIEVESGSYSFSGSSVGLLYGHKVAVGTGSFALTGSNVGLTHQYKTPIDSGSYTYTGSNVGLGHGYKVSISNGAFALTGSNIDFRRTYAASIVAGAYPYTGSAITLTYTPLVLPGGMVCATVYIIPRVDANYSCTPLVVGTDGLIPSVDGNPFLEPC